MQRFYALLLASMLAIPFSFGQMKPHHPKSQTAPKSPENLSPVLPKGADVPMAAPLFLGTKNFDPKMTLSKPIGGQPQLRAHVSPATNTPILIEGEFVADAAKSLDNQVVDYLAAVQDLLGIASPSEEFLVSKTETDELGYSHLRLQQRWKGVPVYGSEAILHKKDGAFYLFNGRTFPSPKITNVTPGITEESASAIALGHSANFTKVKNLTPEELKLTGGQQTKAELVIFYPEKTVGNERLAWHVEVVPNITSRYSAFIDAKTGEVIDFQSQLCKIAGHHSDKGHEICNAPLPTAHCPLPTANCPPPPDGPATANATDLFGQSRLVNTYQKTNLFYLIDASRPMFNASQSVFPDEAVGVIWTIDAGNTSPENSNFSASHLTSSNNSWNNPKAVSAHYHAGVAFNYFKNTFNRNSINGLGGNIVSLINIVDSDNTQMDNAFWNGEAMFYGNGNVAFNAPLAKSLDVAGHEMSHGVVQATANLEYMGESGALNESFADLFGAMIDRNDWKIGEDIVNTSIFPTGALRDMNNPHNGGSSLNDNGWQPAHYSERYLGNDDNGGVHINSGIVNKAFQLFADNASVGKDKAEQVYYRALSNYLVKSSQFIDCRNAVTQAAADLYGGANGAVANAAKAAFDAVGIGAGSGTNTQTDVGVNPGDDFILMSDTDFSQLYIFTPTGQAIANPLTTTAPVSRPSITDDGSYVVFIDEENKMRAISINWQTGQTDEQVIQSETIWRNVAISKDGSHLAAITTDYDNKLWIYDYALAEWQTYDLFNPTTGQGGPTTGDVQYADVLEWDFSGEWVMYDALNSLTTTGADIEYWDISFARVWDNGGDDFGDGFTGKLFSGLPENVSVGNPTFSKNSDYIIAFDYIDDFEGEYFLRAANLETSDLGTIYENSDLSWPNFSPDDNRLVFDAETNTGTPVLAFISLGNDKISASGGASVYLEQGRWGVWFANGERVLVDAGEVVAQQNFRCYPNPVTDQLTLEFVSQKSGEGRLEIFDLMGRKVLAQNFSVGAGDNQQQVSMSGLSSGGYVVRAAFDEGVVTFKVVKK